MKKLFITLSFLFAFLTSYKANAQCKATIEYWIGDTTNTYQFYSAGSWGFSYKYTWDFGDGSSVVFSEYPIHKYTKKGTYKVTFIVYSTTLKCADTAYATIVADGKNPCNADFTATQDKSNSLKWYFKAKDTLEDYYTWYTPASSGSTKNHSATFSSNGSYKVYLDVGNSKDHCRDTVIKTINVVKKCPVTLSYFIHDTINNYHFDTYVGSRNNWPQYSYKWDLGDGNTSTRQGNLDHTYKSNGTYKVCVYTDSSGCKDTACVTIVANKKNPCNANFTAVQDKSNPLICHFAAIDTMEDYYDWGWSRGSKKYTHTFASKGTYTMSLWVHNYKDHCRDTVVKSINVKKCSADFTARVDSNNSLKWYFNTLSTLPSTTKYYWTFGDGASSTSANPSNTYHKNAAALVYNVCLKISDSATKCYDTMCVTITVNPKVCYANFTVSINNTTNTATFTNTSSSNMTHFKWYFGDGKTSTAKSPSHTYTAAGNYTIVLIATDSVKKCTDTAEMSISISGCDSYFTYSISDTVLRYYHNNPSSYKVKWDFGNGKTSTKDSGHYSYPKSGTYNLCLTVYCSSIDSGVSCVSITIKPRCQALFSVALDTTQKFKLYLINKSSNTGSTQYTWDFGDGNYSGKRNPTHKYSKFGKYNVCLLVIDTAINCSSKYCDTLGLDSSGKLLKVDAWELIVLEQTVFGVKKIVKQDFKIYPNPANTKVTIDLSNAINTYQKLEILNSNGQVCITQPIEAGNDIIDIDLEKIARGLYLIKLGNENGYSYKKLIKN